MQWQAGQAQTDSVFLFEENIRESQESISEKNRFELVVKFSVAEISIFVARWAKCLGEDDFSRNKNGMTISPL